MSLKKVGKRQMSRIITEKVKKICSELEFENTLALTSDVIEENVQHSFPRTLLNKPLVENENILIEENITHSRDSPSTSSFSSPINNFSEDESLWSNHENIILKENDLGENLWSDHKNINLENSDITSLSKTEILRHVRDNLAQWAVKHSIAHVALNDILKIFSPIFPGLPTDARTLLCTPREVCLKTLSNGNYYHFGLTNAIKKSLTLWQQSNQQLMELDFNIDGIPLYRSTSTSFWPILGRISGFSQKPFIIGIFCGSKKPSPLNDFLYDFIAELKNLVINGINIGNNKINVTVRSFICDAPARSYIKCIKSHTGYYSCERCQVQGSYFGDRVTFPATKSAPRTDSSFAALECDEHHLTVSPLTEIPGLGMVSNFVLDYMHLICLGVMRKLLFIWVSGNVPSLKMPSKIVDEISDRMTDISDYIPVEFSRKPRTLREIKRWKATEMRQFLLYTGLIVLKDKVDEAIYQNFLLLHSAVFILIHNIAEVDLAEQLLQIFVSHSIELYGQTFCTYNVHSLLHITDDVKRFGPLDTFSCFPFESFLGQIKNMLRSTAKPLQQIVKRISELQLEDGQSVLLEGGVKFKGHHSDGPLVEILSSGTQYKQLVTTSFTLKINRAGDSCCFINNSVCVAQNFVEHNGSKYIIYKMYKYKDDAYNYPFPSQKLKILSVSHLSRILYYTRIENINCKCISLPVKNNVYCFSLQNKI